MLRVAIPKTMAPHSLLEVHRDLAACRACPKMIGPVVHGPPVMSRIILIGQAPGPREGAIGRPFAWTAGKTLFRWFEEALGVSEERFRECVYIAAVARCFPGKASGGGDRKPDPGEIERCESFLVREVLALQPRLVIPVGALAIEQVLGKKGPMKDIIGTTARVRYHGVLTDVIALPHPSGVSPWHKLEPGKTLLHQALARIKEHPEVSRVFETGREKD